MMKSIKSILLVSLLMGPLAATVAHAQHWHGGGWHGGARVGLFVDPWPLYPYAYAPYGYYPYYASAPAVVEQVAPTVYVEQGNAPVQQGQQGAPATYAQPASSDWFYCRKPEGYYPYIKNCAGGWERVPSQPAQH